MPSEAGIADCRVSECDRKTVPRCGTRNRKCSTAVCGQSVTCDHKCVLLSRPKALPWHDSAHWDDMVQQIVRCTAVQTPMSRRPCFSTTFTRSATYRTNSSGPRTEPWGTEHTMKTTADVPAPYTTRNYISSTFCCATTILIGNESVPKIIVNDTVIFFLKLQSAFL